MLPCNKSCNVYKRECIACKDLYRFSEGNVCITEVMCINW